MTQPKAEKAPLPEMSAEEKAGAEAALQRFSGRRRTARVKLHRGEDGTVTVAAPHAFDALSAVQIADAMGTGSVAFSQTQVRNLVGVAMGRPERAESAVNAMLAMVQAVEAEDEVVGQLAVQMAATHEAAMQALGQAAQAKTADATEALGNLANKLMRTYTMQAEALAKLRRGGEQKVKVEHVHVYDGGQAIVGNVTQPPGGSRKTESQPHAPTDPRALAFAPVGPVLCPDPERHRVPSAGGQREGTVPDARRRQGKRRAAG